MLPPLPMDNEPDCEWDFPFGGGSFTPRPANISTLTFVSFVFNAIRVFGLVCSGFSECLC